MLIGKQENGSSAGSIKQMALTAIRNTGLSHFKTILDIGGGQGDLAALICKMADQVILLDAQPSPSNGNISTLTCDLNDKWEVPASSTDLVMALEVVEHLENPRHFFREIYQVLKPGGYAFISTPHNLNLFARLLFFFKGEHRHFQDFSYPAHITALLPIDIKRLIAESGLLFNRFYYNYQDVLPGLKKNIFIKSRHFSNSIGVLCQKPF